MLIQPDKSQLGDKHLNPEESVIRERADLLKMASKAKIHGQDELEDQERARGPRLQYTELIGRLRRLNPALRFEDGAPGQIAVYRPKTRAEYDEEERDPSQHAWRWDFVYVCGFPKEEVPEFGFVTVDTSHLAHREQKSWRSTLIALIKSGAIKYKDAVKVFGEPDSRGGRWSEQLAKYKEK